MEFNNLPKTATMHYSAASETKRTNWFTIVSIGLILALLVTLGYAIWDNSKIKDTIQQKNGEYADMLMKRDTLQSLLDDASMRYDLLKTINVKRDSTIATQEREITKIRSLIQSLMATVKINQMEHAELRHLIAALNTNIDGYKKQIETSTAENLAIVQQKEMAATIAEKAKVTEAPKVAVPSSSVETDLNDYGSTFYATNFSNTGFEESKSGRMKKTRSARKVDLLRVSFDLLENHNSTAGKKDLYVAISSPDGSPLTIEALGSGKFVTRDGTNKSYTKKVSLEYVPGKLQSISFDWKQNSKFESGNYKIEVFNSGYKIGEGVCKFKKSGVFD
jgi:hypothetical protein